MNISTTNTRTSIEQTVVGADETTSTRENLEALQHNLKTVRHGINNNVAVIMAMAELSQRNPAQTAKLCQLCLEKAPQIAASVASFSELFDNALQAEQNRA